MKPKRAKPLSRERKAKALKHGEPPKRKAPLKRTTQLRSGGPLPPQSAKRRQVAVERRNFVTDFLAAHPRCMVHWDGGCTGWAVHVHEALPRGRGGVIVPTPGRNQKFVGTCWWCHAQIHDHPAEAEARGWLLSARRGVNPDLVVVEQPPESTTQDFIRATAARYGL